MMIDTTVTAYSSSPTLLLALENQELTDHFSMMLQSAGFSVLPASGPAEAERILAAGIADLALVDVEWGTATVEQLAQVARSGEHPCQVAVVVGWWDARVSEVLGAADTLVYKPPTQRQLLGAIQPLLDRPALVRLPA